MRRALWVVAFFTAVSAWSTESRAQTSGGFDDPFFLYYSYYLPRQAALAAQPRVEDTINQNFINNQATARTNRAALTDPLGSYGAFDNYDPNDVFDKGMKRGRNGGNQPERNVFRSLPSSNISGRGPGQYYNRAAAFYPSLRTGIGPNHNLAVAGRGARRSGGFGGAGGGGSVPSATSGMSMGPR